MAEKEAQRLRDLAEKAAKEMAVKLLEEKLAREKA